MNKTFIISMSVVIILLVAASVFLTGNTISSSSDSQTQNENTNSGDNSNIEDQNIDTNVDSTGISREQLALHNSRSDCWIAYDGRVYDITDFLPKHPGSAGAISPYCGTTEEFQQSFERQHGTTKVQMLMSVGVFMGDFDYQGTLG